MHLEITDMRTLTDATPNVRELEFRNAPVTVGSGSDNLVQLPDINIAAHHATLQPMGDHWLYEPTIRDGETKINGEPVADKTEIHDGDVIEISHFSLKVTLDAEVQFELPDPAKVDELAKIRQYPLPPRSEVRKPDADVAMTAARQKVLAAYVMKLRECRDLARVLETTVEMLRSELSARVAWMGVRKEPSGPLEFIETRSELGTRIDVPPNLETFVYRCLTRRQYISVPRTGHPDTQSVIAVPLAAARGAIGLLYVDTRKRTRVFDEADLDFVTLVAALVTPLLEGVLDAPLSKAEAVTRDALSWVQEVRAKLDPQHLPQWPSLQVAAYSKTGADSAGDVYDVMKMPNGLAAFLIGHVTASPIRTAQVTAQLHGAFRVAGLHADPPHVQLKAMNWLLFDEDDPCRVDMAVIVANPKSGAMEIATAGKVGVLLIDPEGQPKRLGHPQSPAVGTVKSAEYAGIGARIHEGESLALFTRGWTTACNDAGTPLGEAKFIRTLCDSVGQPAAAALNELVSDLTSFLKNGRAVDDITLLLVHRPSG
jgi:serine phosphatase RsbU (regulator of sigma subunit)